MAKIQISKVNAVPTGAAIVANTMYYVSVSAEKMEMYLSDSTGTALKRLINQSDIDSSIALAAAGNNTYEVVATIADRNALSLTNNTLVLVNDASADATVDAGAALYSYTNATSSFDKIAEYESLDIVFDWASIQNKPTSTVAEIDAAVAASNHINRTQLDLITEDSDGDMNYNGSKVANVFVATDW